MNPIPFVPPTLACVAYVVLMGFWIRHCFRAMETSHPWLHPMPAWRRFAFDPTLALLGSLPVLYGLILWFGVVLAQALS